MRKVFIASSTHLDRHNTIVTREALEKAAEAINNGKKPVLTVEHDTTLPPIGQVVRAWVEPTEDGEYKLLDEWEIFEKEGPIILSDGSSGIVRESEITHFAFVDKEISIPEKVTLKADFVNFTSLDEFEAFFEEVQSGSPIPFERGIIGRKAFIPDPEVIITISEGILIYLASKGIIDKLVNKIADRLGDEIAGDIVGFYIWIKSVATKLGKYIVPKNRPITYIFSFPIIPHVELIARTSDADEIAASIMEDNIEKPLREAEYYRARLGATKVQFLLDKKGEWKFNYLLTDKGQVIGTKASFSRKARQIDLPQPTNAAIKRPKQSPKLKRGRIRK